MTEEVKQAAHVSFLRHGLMNTRDRTGVLVFVSLRERRVQILADKGISDKVGKGYWKEEALKLVERIQAGRAAEGMVSVIQDIGQKLEKHFPRKADDTNELSNSLRSE
jgi:putative membrane protein